VQVELPAMERYRGICFVDTPGLDSVFEHNTDASIEWLPNTGLALVAVGVDPPLSAHDIELIRDLSRFTPNISVLLTKVDTLAPDERTEVEGFVRGNWDVIGMARCRCILTRSGPASRVCASDSTSNFWRARALEPGTTRRHIAAQDRVARGRVPRLSRTSR
jgi:hypothetical protein